MINFPHALPLPGLSKQGRARNRKRREERRLGKESLAYSNCLNFPAGPEAGAHGPSRRQFPPQHGASPHALTHANLPGATSSRREARPRPRYKPVGGINVEGINVLMPTQHRVPKHRALVWDPLTFIRLSERNGREGKGAKKGVCFFFF